MMKNNKGAFIQDRKLSQCLLYNKSEQKQQKDLSFSQNAFNIIAKQSKLLNPVRQSKQTFSTNNSLRDEIQNSLVDQLVQQFHNFTFYPTDIQKLQSQQLIPLKNKYKYSNKSFECVIFYALIFNQLHLEEIKQILPAISSTNLNCYQVIKKNLLNYDEIMIKRQLEDYIFPQSAFRLIQNKSLSLKDRKVWLKGLIDKIDHSIASQLVQYICKDTNRSSNMNETLSKKENNSLMNLDQLADHFGIKIKYFSEFKRLSLGRKNSCVAISIKETEDKFFHLKKISCYEVKQ